MPGDADDARTVLQPWETMRLVGHRKAEQTLLDAYRADKLHHAWLVGGPVGVGKATLSWRLARFLLAHPDPHVAAVQSAETLEVPATSPAAQRIAAGSSGDVFPLRREWNEKTKKLFSEIRVDDVRRALGLFQRAAASGGYRICIIDSAEDLNRSSANALLKVIEEPPPRSLFLIVAHRPGQVMPTLMSRCRRLILQPLPQTDVVDTVRALGPPFAALPPDRIADAAARAGGSVAEALRRLNGETMDIDRSVRALIDGLPAVDWRAVHRLADRIGFAEDEFAVATEALLDSVADRMRRAAAQGRDARALWPLADAWERIEVARREAEVLNLDKRPLLLNVFAELAQATRRG